MRFGFSIDQEKIDKSDLISAWRDEEPTSFAIGGSPTFSET
jgi:hypothetical protein